MDQVGTEGPLMDALSEDEVETVFDKVVAPPSVEAMEAEAPIPEAAATVEVSERLHSLVGRSEMQRLAEDEMAGFQSTATPDEWFVESGGKSVGPLTTEEMKERWSQGLIGPDTPCWSAAFQGWIPVCRVPALTQALAPPPPPEVAPSQLTLPEVALTPRASEALKELIQQRRPQPPPPPAAPPVERLAAPPQFAAWLPPQPQPQPPPPAPEPRSSGPGSGRIALYVTLSAIVGSIAGAALLGVFALHLLRASPAPAPVPAPIAATPAPAPAPTPAPAPAPTAAAAPTPPPPAAEAAAPVVQPDPMPVAAAPKAPAVEKPKRIAAAPKPKPEPTAARENEDEAEGSEGTEPVESKAKPKSKFAPMPKEDPELVEDFDQAFGSPEGQKKPERTVYVPPAPGGAAPKAQLGQGDIMQVVVAHKAQVRKCKEAAEESIPGISGKLVMRWSVTTSGEVEDVEALSGDLEGTALADCVANAIRGWKFPEHTEAQPPVTFPFVF